MRLQIKKSGRFTYLYVIKSFRENGKSSSKVVEKYHAVTSSQMAAKWHDFEQDGDRYDLQYRTAGDELVRAEHRALHNITLPPSDPFWSQFLPPNGRNCRCTVVQVRKNKYPTSDSAKAIETGESITADPKAQMFRFNPGKKLKLFPDKHPYLPKGCDGCRQVLLLAKGKGKPICAACNTITKQADMRVIEKRRTEYDAHEYSWVKEYFNEINGGYLAVDTSRKPNARTSKNDVQKYNKEHDMCVALSRAGYRIEMLKEQSGISSPDITINGMTADLKRTKSHVNILNYAKDAFEKKHAQAVVFQFDEETKKVYAELSELKNKKHKVYYFFKGKENVIHQL